MVCVVFTLFTLFPGEISLFQGYPIIHTAFQFFSPPHVPTSSKSPSESPCLLLFQRNLVFPTCMSCFPLSNILISLLPVRETLFPSVCPLSNLLLSPLGLHITNLPPVFLLLLAGSLKLHSGISHLKNKGTNKNKILPHVYLIVYSGYL